MLSNSGQKPNEQFGDAARAILATPQDMRERDLAQSIIELAKTAGVDDTPDHAAFRAQQAELGQRITNESDAGVRAELRDGREAKGNLYAAALADNIAERVASLGQFDGAAELIALAEARREIAARLQPSPSPDRNDDKAGQDKAEFARAAAEASGLGPTAQTIHVAEMAGRDPGDVGSRAGGRDYSALSANNDHDGAEQPDQESARTNARLRNAIRPEIVNDLGTYTATRQYSAAPARRVQVEDQPDDKQEAEASYRRSLDSAEAADINRAAQEGRELGVGRGDATPDAALASLKEHKAAMAKDRGHAPEADREAGERAQAFRSFGR